jgi:hypothetical protein
VISGDDGEAVLVHQDAWAFVSRLNPGVEATHAGCRPRRLLVRDRGDADAAGEGMTTGDAAEIWDEPRVSICANATTELIAVDVALG